MGIRVVTPMGVPDSLITFLVTGYLYATAPPALNSERAWKWEDSLSSSW